MQLREQLEDPRQRPVTGAGAAGESGQILAHGKAWENAALLRHKTEAKPREGVRRQRSDIAPVVSDASGPRMQVAHHGEDGRGLTGAVSPQQADHLALAYRERYAMQDMAVAVIRVDILELEHQRAMPR